MPISTADLQNLVARSARRATAEELEATHRVLAALGAARTTARLDSPGSRWLQELPRRFEAYLRPEAFAALDDVEIYFVDIAYPNAIPLTQDGAGRIFVFEGLLRCTAFVIDLIRVLASLQQERAGARIVVSGEEVQEALAVSEAGFSVLSDALAQHRFPDAVGDMLGHRVRQEAEEAHELAALFVLLHELGHLRLGHCDLDGLRGEREHFDLVEPEALSDYQADEIAADAFALDLLKPERRAELLPSLMFFFLPFAFMEAFSGGFSCRHPLCINRLAALVSRAEMDLADRQIVMGWIEGQVNRMRDLAGDRAALGPRLRARIEENAPVAFARRLLVEVKARVAVETGPLGGA